jgi:hypothetical protein
MTGGSSVSANGSDVASGIVWAVTTQFEKGDHIPGTLHAFRASDVTQEIYNSDMNSARDALGDFTRFAPPVVANGKVYVTTQSKAVNVYGLLCGTDVSSRVSVDTGRRNAARKFLHAINYGENNLTPGVTSTSATGATSCASPAGRPLIRSTALRSGLRRARRLPPPSHSQRRRTKSASLRAFSAASAAGSLRPEVGVTLYRR